MMLNELCLELRNFFDKGQPKFYGEIKIEDGTIQNEEILEKMKAGQYFRIVGSIFNDGTYCFNEELELEDETFDGSIWLMAVPKAVLELAKDIDDWVAEYGSHVNSPYTSESFGGFSYSKASGKGGTGTANWQDVFAQRMNLYRRIRI